MRHSEDKLTVGSKQLADKTDDATSLLSLPTANRQLPTTSSTQRRIAVSALWESFRVAVGSLRANKLRAGLTLIGIIVGVSAVIAVVTIIKGLDQTVASTFSSQGSTVFTISKRPQIITSREDFLRFNKRKNVVQDDADAITRLCTTCWRTGISANIPRRLSNTEIKNPTR
jgi:hypothetical protein